MSYATQVPPFRFRYTGDSKLKTLSRPQPHADAISAKQRRKIEWEKKMERQRLENPITYEIIPASTPGFVHLHRVAATRGVITSDTWETVPEDDLKADLYRVRMQDNPSPLAHSSPVTHPTASRNKTESSSATQIDVPSVHNNTIAMEFQTSNQSFPLPPTDADAMDIDM